MYQHKRDNGKVRLTSASFLDELVVDNLIESWARRLRPKRRSLLLRPPFGRRVHKAERICSTACVCFPARANSAAASTNPPSSDAIFAAAEKSANLINRVFAESVNPKA